MRDAARVERKAELFGRWGVFWHGASLRLFQAELFGRWGVFWHSASLRLFQLVGSMCTRLFVDEGVIGAENSPVFFRVAASATHRKNEQGRGCFRGVTVLF